MPAIFKLLPMAKPGEAISMISGFALLFFVYHRAESKIMRGDVAGFFGNQLLFLLALAFVLTCQKNTGLQSPGLRKPLPGQPGLVGGIITGGCLYLATWGFNLFTKIEVITKVPGMESIVSQTIPFSFGVLFSSFSEDMLTRGYLYSHLGKKISGPAFIAVSSIVYLLNHIHKIHQPPEAWLYILLLGILFAIPLVFTKSIWFTVAMHWFGNSIFYFTHTVIVTESDGAKISPNYIFCIGIVIFILVIGVYFFKRAGAAGIQQQG